MKRRNPITQSSLRFVELQTFHQRKPLREVALTAFEAIVLIVFLGFVISQFLQGV